MTAPISSIQSPTVKHYEKGRRKEMKRRNFHSLIKRYTSSQTRLGFRIQSMIEPSGPRAVGCIVVRLTEGQKPGRSRLTPTYSRFRFLQRFADLPFCRLGGSFRLRAVRRCEVGRCRNTHCRRCGSSSRVTRAPTHFTPCREKPAACQGRRHSDGVKDLHDAVACTSLQLGRTALMATHQPGLECPNPDSDSRERAHFPRDGAVRRCQLIENRKMVMLRQRQQCTGKAAPRYSELLRLPLQLRQFAGTVSHHQWARAERQVQRAQ